MEEIHKKILQRNRTNLVRDLDPSSLYDGLLEKGVFTRDMIDEIKSSGTRRDQARKLVQDLETRGSRAFAILLLCLEETSQHGLAELLRRGAPAPQIHPATPHRVDLPVVRPLPLSLCTDVEQQGKDNVPIYPIQKPSPTLSPSPEREYPRTRPPGRIRRDSIQSYKMDASPCGHCLIINNVDFEPDSELSSRKGSNIDCDKLEKRFKALNFIVEVRTNLKQRQIKHALSALSKKDHSQCDCCVVIMLSHGTEGKPKLFFIQACGGDERDTGFEVSPDEVEPSIGGADDQTDAIPMSSSSDSLSLSDEVDARATLPTPSDILVSYSTFPGYVSWRDTQSGSWYVETLDQVLEENAATDDLVTMLMMVNHEVSQNSAKGLYKQMPGSFNFLRKLLHFQTHV
ncbi:caspase-9 isoform 2-T2 [Spinachia spinachia]